MMIVAYPRETKVCKEWIANRIDHNISLSKHILDVKMREGQHLPLSNPREQWVGSWYAEHGCLC